jgi:methyl-accepting chemotaxis protein
VPAREHGTLPLASVTLAARSGTLLEALLPSIPKTAERAQEIAAASREQDAGAEQINKAIQQLDQVIQQNASASEEMASTAEELTGQSEQLQELIAFFQVEEGRRADEGKLAATVQTEENRRAVRYADEGGGKGTTGQGHSPQNSNLQGLAIDLDLGRNERNGDKLDAEFERF